MNQFSCFGANESHNRCIGEATAKKREWFCRKKIFHANIKFMGTETLRNQVAMNSQGWTLVKLLIWRPPWQLWSLWKAAACLFLLFFVLFFVFFLLEKRLVHFRKQIESWGRRLGEILKQKLETSARKINIELRLPAGQ